MPLREFTVETNGVFGKPVLVHKKNPRKNPAVCKVPNYKRSLFKK
jgi:hypothetical protein